jgi:hypothetical protein
MNPHSATVVDRNGRHTFVSETRGARETQLGCSWAWCSVTAPGFSSTSAAEIRHGVAFSFETSQTLPSIDPLTKKAGRLGEFIKDHEREFADMRMWHYSGEKLRQLRSSDYPAGPVMPEIVQEGCFLFLGKRQPVATVDPNSILCDFDRLLPLYCFVEGTAETRSTADQPQNAFASDRGVRPARPARPRRLPSANLTSASSTTCCKTRCARS